MTAHRSSVKLRLRWHRCPRPSSGSPVRSVCCCAGETPAHPQGGGSEAYLQRIGAQLAAVRRRRDPAHRPVSGGRAPRSRRRRRRSAARAGRYSVYVLAMLAMSRRTDRARTAAADASRRRGRHPERPAVHGTAGVRPPDGRAGAPLPPRAVAGRRLVLEPDRLVRRVAAVAATAPHATST